MTGHERMAVGLVAVALGGALLLGGCTAAGAGTGAPGSGAGGGGSDAGGGGPFPSWGPSLLGAFGVPQTEADRLPVGATGNVVEGVQADSTRLLHTDGTLEVYVALSAGSPGSESNPAGRECIVLVRELEAMAGCGGIPMTVSGQGFGEFSLSFDTPSGDGWTEVADDLWTRDR